MKTFKEDLIKMYQTERGIIILMILNFILATSFLIFVAVHLNPNAAVVKTGYSDITGYRDGSWTESFAFIIMAVLLGIMHNILTLRIFHKRGGGMAKFFLLTTSALILGAFLVLIRVLGES